MPGKVFIEEHLEHYLKSFSEENAYIPGVIIGQVIGENYYVVHLSAITIWNEDLQDVLAYSYINDLLSNSDTIFQKSLEIINLLPGGSHVLGLFFIVPQDSKSIQPLNINFYEFNKQLNEHMICNSNSKTWKYLMLNYSTVNKKSFCYTVDSNKLNGSVKTTYKAIDDVFGSFDNDWITLVGTFNFKTLDRLNVSSGPKVLLSVREELLDKLESVLNESIYTFNGSVCDENETLQQFECDPAGDFLKNVVHIECFKVVDLGDQCKNASLKVERGKGKIFMSGLCSLAVPFNRNGTVKDAIKAIHDDIMKTFAIRLKMHFESFVEEESIEEEDGDSNILHETPRRVLILKTEGSRFAFSDYVFPGETPQEALTVAGEILNLPAEKMELYDLLEKGRHSYYETLPDNIDSSTPQATSIVTSNNISYIYFVWAALILAIIAFAVKQIFV